MTIFQDSILVVIFILLFVVFLGLCALIDCVYRVYRAKKHRRQHNTFEIGDRVVSDFYQLDSVFLISHICNDDEFIYSNKVFLLGSVFTTSDKLKGECRFLFNEIRHATPEEIKAGRRL